MSRRSWIASEGGLLLLSLVLAVMVWYVVRDVVDEFRTQEVTVVPQAPPGHYAIAEEKVVLSFRGKRGEIDKALVDLAKRGYMVPLEVNPLAPMVNERPFDGRDAYQFPFQERLLEPKPARPRGVVVRIEERVVRVREPELEGQRPEGLNVRLELSKATIAVSAPASALDDEIVPDPIDLGTILKPGHPLSAPSHVTLTFERWRRGADLAGLQPTERTSRVRRRAVVVLPEITATLSFEVSASGNLTNAVEVIVKRGYEVREIAPATNAAAFTGTLAIGLTFIGRMTSTEEILKDLEERNDGWRWVLIVPEGDLPKGEEPKEVTARLQFVAFERFQDLWAQGYIRFEPVNVPVQVVRVR